MPSKNKLVKKIYHVNVTYRMEWFTQYQDAIIYNQKLIKQTKAKINRLKQSYRKVKTTNAKLLMRAQIEKEQINLKYYKDVARDVSKPKLAYDTAITHEGKVVGITYKQFIEDFNYATISEVLEDRGTKESMFKYYVEYYFYGNWDLAIEAYETAYDLYAEGYKRGGIL